MPCTLGGLGELDIVGEVKGTRAGRSEVAVVVSVEGGEVDVVGDKSLLKLCEGIQWERALGLDCWWHECGCLMVQLME
jgi:hypothetical protein